MSGKWSLKRGILHTLIVALVLSALVGIYASDSMARSHFRPISGKAKLLLSRFSARFQLGGSLARLALPVLKLVPRGIRMRFRIAL